MPDKMTIVTLNDPTNYGNRLQNYALKRLLQQYGSVTTAYSMTRRGLPTSITRMMMGAQRHVKNMVRGFKTHSYGAIRQHDRRCIQFTKKYVPTTVDIDLYRGVVPKKNISEYYVLGSDQIWNYSTIDSEERAKRFSLYLGSFVPKGSQVFSYAASIGVSQLPSKPVEAVFKKFLPQMRAVSVREFRGAQLIAEVTGIDATVVLDPTLMIDQKQWMEITEDFVPENDRYVLTYFLGRPSEEQEKTIQEYAKKHNCRIRRMLDLRDLDTYVAGPQDFVELFAKAQYVFTDSYHACCFSILFHRQFTVFNRKGFSNNTSSMNSRMETLFKLFNLQAVVMNAGLSPQIDYAEVDKLLAMHRLNSRKWVDAIMK